VSPGGAERSIVPSGVRTGEAGLVQSFDAIGLALFVVTGDNIALVAGANDVAAATIGVISGIGGGIIRDMLANEAPGVLTDGRLYMTAALVGAASYILLLQLGNLGSQVLDGAVLYGSLLAYGAEGELLVLAVVANTAATLLGGLSPVPGGVGLWEGTAVAVRTTGGIDPTTGPVAVLTQRMLTYYLPPLYGYVGFNWLENPDDL
jgi:hypothetical protein